jgi:hypothetical protein
MMNEIGAMVILKEIHSANQSIMLSSDNESFQNYKLLDCEALTIAIQALEKQIPKKPIEIRERRNFNFEVYLKDGYCPLCKNEVNNAYNYCNKCGQALDWSVE